MTTLFTTNHWKAFANQAHEPAEYTLEAWKNTAKHYTRVDASGLDSEKTNANVQPILTVHDESIIWHHLNEPISMALSQMVLCRFITGYIMYTYWHHMQHGCFVGYRNNPQPPSCWSPDDENASEEYWEYGGMRWYKTEYCTVPWCNRLLSHLAEIENFDYDENRNYYDYHPVCRKHCSNKTWRGERVKKYIPWGTTDTTVYEVEIP